MIKTILPIGIGVAIGGIAFYAVYKFLKSKDKNIKVVGIQPDERSLPSKDNPHPEEITGVHPFEGIPDDRKQRNDDQEAQNDYKEYQKNIIWFREKCFDSIPTFFHILSPLNKKRDQAYRSPRPFLVD